MKKKINKHDFIERVAQKCSVPKKTVQLVYDTAVDEMCDSVCHGEELSFTGFGSFALKKHKGHPVQFDAKNDTVKDYMVLKFSPSDILMKRIRNTYKES